MISSVDIRALWLMSLMRSMITAWVVTSSPVVGSSAIRIDGVQASAMAFWVRDADARQRGDRGFLQIAAWEVGVFEQHVLDLLSYLSNGVQGGAGALEDHGHFTPAQFAQRFRLRRQQIDAAHRNAAVGDFGRLIVETHDGVGGDGFARSTFTDHAQDLAARDGEGNAFQRPHHAVTGAELHRQIVDLELRHHTRFLGSSRSRSPSPSMLKQNTASTRAAPGNMKAHHSPEMM